MLFTKEISVPANTLMADPKVETLKIAHGIISWASVLFPSGCFQMVHCVILHHEHQIFPSTEGMSMTGNTFPIEWSEYYESYQSPYELKIKCWSPATKHDHTVTVRIAILPRKAVVATSVTDAIGNMFGLLLPKRIHINRKGVQNG